MATPLPADSYKDKFKLPLPFDVDTTSPGPGAKDEIDDRVSLPPEGIGFDFAQGTLPPVPGLPTFTAAPPNKWPSVAPGL